MDECDISAQTAANYLKADIARARERKTGPSAFVCTDCGYVIAEERRKAAPGCTRCIICQKDWERHHGNI